MASMHSTLWCRDLPSRPQPEMGTILVTGASHDGVKAGSGGPPANVRHIRTSRSVRLNLGYRIARTSTGYAA